jgi:HAD superfamily hydrolase (TIGR01509 family)
MTLRAVLLDVDGTLVDSNDAHAESWAAVLAEFGYQVDLQHVRCLIGKGGDKLLPETTGIAKDSELGKRIIERRAVRFKEDYLPRLAGFPRAQELLKRLNAQGLTLVVATSANRDELESLLRVIDSTDLLGDATSSSDAARSKPDEDIIEAALRKSECAPGEALMLGDTPYDIEAAARAGVRCIALRCGGWDDGALKGAIAIYDDPQQLLEQFERSPFVSGKGAGAANGRANDDTRQV